MPTTITVRLLGDVLLEGTFFAPVKSDGDFEWEMATVDGGKAMVISLNKYEKDKPFWTYLLQGHPEVDVRGMKRDPKELEELLAESNLGNMMGQMGPGGMPPIDKVMEGLK